MSLEINKRDFEEKLEKLRDISSSLLDKNILSSDFCDAVSGVIDEYDKHLSSDIEKMQGKCSDAVSTLIELNTRYEDLQKEIKINEERHAETVEGLNKTIEELCTPC